MHMNCHLILDSEKHREKIKMKDVECEEKYFCWETGIVKCYKLLV